MAGGHGGARAGAGRPPANHVRPPERVDFEVERAAHEKVKREQREFHLAQERGEYVSREATRQACAAALTMLTQSLRSIADNCERQLSIEPVVAEAIQTMIDGALTDLATTFRSIAEGPG